MELHGSIVTDGVVKEEDYSLALTDPLMARPRKPTRRRRSHLHFLVVVVLLHLIDGMDGRVEQNLTLDQNDIGGVTMVVAVAVVLFVTMNHYYQLLCVANQAAVDLFHLSSYWYLSLLLRHSY